MSDKVAAVFEAGTQHELSRSYDELAPSYDAELDTDLGPQRAVEVVTRHVPQEARVLDAGCGTGRVGQLLYERGFRNLEGLDLSPGMLAQARKKRCYTMLYEGTLGGSLDFADDEFDAVVGVGVFVRGHAPSASLTELIRVTKPQSHVVFTLRPEFYEGSDFKSTMNGLSESGAWRWVETTKAFNARYREFPDINLQVWVFQVLSTPSQQEA